MKKILIFLLTINCIRLFAQPKYEFRAVWVATVNNIDWPSKPGLSTDLQKKEAVNILNMHRDLGMNAVILQVRPAADAFYPSELEPWSRYLTGTPGKAPEPFYDPLKFWIEEAHKRGMEFHAWLNPFRVAQNADEMLAGNHVAFQHPDWILKYGNKLFFDPGIPAAREFVVQVVKDIVKRYDVDAIHFDDYFYPYPTSEDFPDTASFRSYNRGFGPEHKADWRRENVDLLIRTLSDTIKSVKPWVKFGISPFGVWRNRSDDPEGSETRAGATNYDHLYADVIRWQKNGWIDYLLPQLYWQIGHPAVDFELLARWWNDHRFNKTLFIGHAAYKIDKNSATEAWKNPGELPEQIRLIRSVSGIEGSAFYSSKHFMRDLLGLQDSLKNNLYSHPAIIPPMKWIDEIPPGPVRKIKKSGRKIKWKTPSTADETNRPNLFVVYRNRVGNTLNPDDSSNILAVVKENNLKLPKRKGKKERIEIRVSVLDRLNNESELSKPVKLKW